MTPKGSKTKGETQISTYASAVERKFRASLGMCPYFIWQIQLVTSGCYSAMRLVSQRSELHSYNKESRQEAATTVVR